jgi:hypothetical protein
VKQSSLVSAEVSQAAVAQVSSCEACRPEAAEFPFEWLIDDVMEFSGVHTDYLMEEPPACPRCGATVSQKTLVECDGGVEVNE